MKTFLKFSGIISLVIAVVAFILMLACPGAVYSDYSVGGSVVVFGGTMAKGNGWSLGHWNLSVVALIAFILVLVALIILIAGIVLPLVKVTALDKFAGVLNLVAVCCLIAAGILCFFAALGFKQANSDVLKNATVNLGVGMVLAAIFYIVAGVVAVAPAAADFISKK